MVSPLVVDPCHMLHKNNVTAQVQLVENTRLRIKIYENPRESIKAQERQLKMRRIQRGIVYNEKANVSAHVRSTLDGTTFCFKAKIIFSFCFLSLIFFSIVIKN